MQKVAKRTITGAHNLTRNNVILEKSNILPLLNEAKRAATVFHYKNSISTHSHIQLLGRTPATDLMKHRVRSINFIT